MLRSYISCLLFQLFFSFGLYAQDYSLIADKYSNNKGDSVMYVLYQGRGLDSTAIAPETVGNLSVFSYLQGGKKIPDLKIDSTAFVRFSAQQQNTGQSLLTVEFSGGKAEHDHLTVEEFANAENLTDLASVIDSSGFTTEYTANTFFTAKALTMTDKNSGGLHSKVEGKQLEIILQQNPYKLLYGDDIIAVAYLNGKPQKGVSIVIYTKAMNGQIFAARYRSNDDGQFFFKLNRSGLWLVQAVYANPSEEEGVNYNFYQSSYSFRFQ
ncbi:DUF4198 domain-containing protein [Olivibacter sitiensis]|uniref:DUF4198 domain-containing protein n=1 Tax=Olivibacter sitiensis TaxID=376470 RepID=UPI0004298C5E|nr:DUF4198 domain-containing protein [Olivibacter sitiensis]